MSLVLLSYPKLNEEDFNWIQSIRKKHEPRYYEMVDPHFTVVFPVFDKLKEELFSHINSICSNFAPFEFEIKCATVVKDSFSDYWDVFLVPDKGNSDFIKLHDLLYTGNLAENLLLDIPYIPHVGIAASKDVNEVKQIADKINSIDISIKGKITDLDLVYYDYPKLETVEKIELKSFQEV